jgi:hypothetical protein
VRRGSARLALDDPKHFRPSGEGTRDDDDDEVIVVLDDTCGNLVQLYQI